MIPEIINTNVYAENGTIEIRNIQDLYNEYIFK